MDGNEKPPVTFDVTEGHAVERKRFELSTSSLRTNEHPLETTRNQGDYDPSQAGRTTGCTSSTTPTPDQPPSLLVSALFALTQQLTPVDRVTFARLLLADTHPKGDA